MIRIKRQADTVEAIPGYEGVAEIVRHHHEKFDGTGYPWGLAGEQIPPGSRIIALADTYDALRHGRAYREATTCSGAIDVIKRERGAQFDPDLTDRFIDYLRLANEAAFFTDPVCGMPVYHQQDRLTTTCNQRVYYFCSSTCLREFRHRPEKYTKT